MVIPPREPIKNTCVYRLDKLNERPPCQGWFFGIIGVNKKGVFMKNEELMKDELEFMGPGDIEEGEE